MRQVSPGTRRWTRREYERLVETGFFRPGEPIELIGGELRVAEPQGEPHAVVVGLIEDALRAAFGPGWIVREEISERLRHVTVVRFLTFPRN